MSYRVLQAIYEQTPEAGFSHENLVEAQRQARALSEARGLRYLVMVQKDGLWRQIGSYCQGIREPRPDGGRR